MVLSILIAAFVIALLITLLFSAIYRTHGGWSRIWIFFALIFLFALAGGLWMRPYGPVYWGVPWLGILVWAILIALLLAFATAPRRPRTSGTVESKQAQSERLAVNALFWILIALLLVAIVVAFGVP